MNPRTAQAASFYRAELGQGDSNTVPLPQTPSRLKPEMEHRKVVVFLRERKQGAGQMHTRCVNVITRKAALIFVLGLLATGSNTFPAFDTLYASAPAQFVAPCGRPIGSVPSQRGNL
jgi:hypothetical protein